MSPFTRQLAPLLLVAAGSVSPASAQEPAGRRPEPAAQAGPAVPVEPAIGVRLTDDTLADLPIGGNIFSVLETAQPEVISDRFNNGGLNAGEPARLGGFLGSWTQTLYRIGDVDITAPEGGAPLLFPESPFWQRVDITTGLMPIDVNTPGLAVTLEPIRPGKEWTRTIAGSASGGGLTGNGPATGAPAVVRLDTWMQGNALFSGPVSETVGIVFAANVARGSKFARAETTAYADQVASAFAHVVWAPAADRELRTVAWVQRTEVPFADRLAFGQAQATTSDVSTHVQSTFDRRVSAALSWRVFGNISLRSHSSALQPGAAPTADRLRDGPVPGLVDTGDRTDRRWSIGARATIAPATTTGRQQGAQLGVTIDGAGAREAAPFSGRITETLGDVPARVWIYSNPGVESNRHATTVAAFASDRLALSSTATLDAGLRFESVRGSADGAANGISWFTLLPQAHVRWDFSAWKHLALIGGYGRTANRLLTGLLAYGDPAAATANVYRWTSAPLASVPIVAKAGPGTGGDPSFSGIDPGLKRPVTDEFVIGVESRPRPTMTFSLTGIARRETNLVNVVNTGVPITSYAASGVPDAGADWVNPSDDQLLPVYDRLPASFGKDRYLLTNPATEAATMGALMLTAQIHTDKLFTFFGATASATLGSSGNRGFQPTENDQDVLGELYTNPNAGTHARGRLFADRAFTIKWTTTYHFEHDIRAGVIVRYQDGQPFSRLAIVSNLNQGAEAIKAFDNGRSRFTFTGTLDFRLQKGFAVGRSRIDAILDVYNLVALANETEEDVLTGPNFRAPTAMEPPRAVLLGFRVHF